MRKFKYQNDPLSSISSWIVFVSLFKDSLADTYLWILIFLTFSGVINFIYKLYKGEKIELFHIFGIVYPILFIICICITPFFDVILYVLWICIVGSFLVCIYFIKEEDTKSIALLHVMYMTSCALAVPVWWTI